MALQTLVKQEPYLLLLQNNVYIQYSKKFIRWIFFILINSKEVQNKEAILLCHQIRTLSKARLDKKMGSLDVEYRSKVIDVLCMRFGWNKCSLSLLLWKSYVVDIQRLTFKMTFTTMYHIQILNHNSTFLTTYSNIILVTYLYRLGTEIPTFAIMHDIQIFNQSPISITIHSNIISPSYLYHRVILNLTLWEYNIWDKWWGIEWRK